MTNPDVTSIEQSITQAKETAELGAALERLRSNRDFKTVVIKGYFEQEAIRLVHLKADPSMQSADSQKSVITQMDAIGNLHQYFQTINLLANMANKSIEADEEELAELLAELK